MIDIMITKTMLSGGGLNPQDPLNTAMVGSAVQIHVGLAVILL